MIVNKSSFCLGLRCSWAKKVRPRAQHIKLLKFEVAVHIVVDVLACNGLPSMKTLMH